MRTVLVTGGAGFIGSNFVHYTRAHYPNVKIVVLDALTYAGNPESLKPDATDSTDLCELVVGDVCDQPLVDKLVKSADQVVHFAAESHNDNSLRDPAPFLTTNIEGTVTVASACVKYDVPLHHISTDEVFGGSSDRFR